jgi:hypothetical protein
MNESSLKCGAKILTNEKLTTHTFQHINQQHLPNRYRLMLLCEEKIVTVSVDDNRYEKEKEKRHPTKKI